MRMSNYREACSWLQEWRAASTPRRFYRRLRRTAQEQRANLDALLHDRERHDRVPHWCDLDEYRRSVEMLEAELAPSRRRAQTFVLTQEIREDLRRLAQSKAREAAIARHPLHSSFREYLP